MGETTMFLNKKKFYMKIKDIVQNVLKTVQLNLFRKQNKTKYWH